MKKRPLSLAHLSALEMPPVRLVTAALEAGFDSVGLRLVSPVPGGTAYPMETAAEQKELRQICRETGISILNIEIIALTATIDFDATRRVLETAAALSAKRVLATGDDADFSLVADRLATLCDIAAQLDMVVDLEFMPFRAVKSLADAVAVVKKASRSNARVLVDALHLVRSGSSVAELAATDPKLLGLFHICDGPLAGPSADQLIEEARTRRAIPGHGAFPLAEMIQALPAEAPIATEVPLTHAMLDIPLLARLRLLAAQTHALLERVAGSA